MNAQPLTFSQTMDELGVSKRTLHEYVKLGCPSTGKASGRRFNIEAVRAWMDEQGLTGERGAPTVTNEELKAVKLRKETALAEKAELGVMREKHLRIDRKEVEEINIKKFTTLRNKLMGLPASTALACEGLPAAKIEKILEDRIRETLQELSKM